MRNELSNLLSDGVLMDMSLEHNKYNLLVKEPKNSSAKGELTRFTITGLPRDSVAFSLDHTHSNILKKKLKSSSVRNFSWLIDSQHKRANLNCDIVIISPYKNSHRVIVGELKSGLRGKTGHIRNQLRNSHLILEYIFSLLNEYELNEKINFDYKYVVFSNDRKTEKYNEKPQLRRDNESKITYFEVNDNGKIHFNKIESSV